MKNQRIAAIIAVSIPTALTKLISLALVGFISQAGAETHKLNMLPGEYWWVGLSNVG